MKIMNLKFALPMPWERWRPAGVLHFSLSKNSPAGRQRSQVFVHKNLIQLLMAILLCLLTNNTFANPEGLTVQSGSASAVANGNQLNITASQNAFLNWHRLTSARAKRPRSSSLPRNPSFGIRFTTKILRRFTAT